MRAAKTQRAVQWKFDQKALRWDGVEPEAYKFALGDARGMGWRGVTRFTLSGPHATPAPFELRYFELAPGGYSSLEKHSHAHFVVAFRGIGRALVDDRIYDLKPHDVLYVPSLTPHRWVNEKEEPFGFLCPVDTQRDAPQPISDEEWNRLLGDPATAPYVF